MVKIVILLCLIILLYLIYCDIAPTKLDMFIEMHNNTNKLAKKYIISRFILFIIMIVSIATIVELTKIVWYWI